MLGVIRNLRGTRHSPAEDGPFRVFLTPEALAINEARQAHLASLGLDLEGKRVLEVGAGIGLHTPFFVARGCDVLATDGNPQNLAELRRRQPDLPAAVLDLEAETDPYEFGRFDVVYCYGVLYHLRDPDRALQRLAAHCDGQILVETCVALGEASEVHLLRDFASNNQALGGIGCRPTRPWVMQALREHFGHAYATRSQPDHPDFETDWRLPRTQLLYRAVFVGSKVPLDNPQLRDTLPATQDRYHEGADDHAVG
jgi:SAM-dependent methyltransferase